MDEYYDINNPLSLKVLYDSEEFNAAVDSYLDKIDIGSLSLQYGIDWRDVKKAMFILWVQEQPRNAHIDDIKFEMINALRENGLL